MCLRSSFFSCVWCVFCLWNRRQVQWIYRCQPLCCPALPSYSPTFAPPLRSVLKVEIYGFLLQCVSVRKIRQGGRRWYLEGVGGCQPSLPLAKWVQRYQPAFIFNYEPRLWEGKHDANLNNNLNSVNDTGIIFNLYNSAFACKMEFVGQIGLEHHSSVLQRHFFGSRSNIWY